MVVSFFCFRNISPSRKHRASNERLTLCFLYASAAVLRHKGYRQQLAMIATRSQWFLVALLSTFDKMTGVIDSPFSRSTVYLAAVLSMYLRHQRRGKWINGRYSVRNRETNDYVSGGEGAMLVLSQCASRQIGLAAAAALVSTSSPDLRYSATTWSPRFHITDRMTSAGTTRSGGNYSEIFKLLAS